MHIGLSLRRLRNLALCGTLASSIALVVPVMSVPAIADGHTNRMAFVPRVEGELSVEFQSDNTYKADDASAELSDTFTTTELGATFHLAPFFQIVGSFVLEPVLDPTGDRVFEDHGAYAEELYAKFVFSDIGISVGKYNPAFGRAWDATPGIYGVDFAEDYELTERLGVSVGYEFAAGGLGGIALTASLYKVDDTNLSRSILTSRDPEKTRRSDGGPSNTDGLESFALNAEIADVMKSGIGVNVGYRSQAKGIGPDDVDDERGFVAGIFGEHKMHNLKFEWIVEGANFNNADATSADKTYVTAGVQLTFNERYYIAIAGTHRKVDNTGGADFNDRLFQISAGMEVYDGWTVDVGHKWDRTEDVDSRTFGVLIAKSFDFNTAKR
ncbi:MAG: hypothetical protein AAGD43_13285 [Pseudomonadota bacterium]